MPCQMKKIGLYMYVGKHLYNVEHKSPSQDDIYVALSASFSIDLMYKKFS